MLHHTGEFVMTAKRQTLTEPLQTNGRMQPSPLAEQLRIQSGGILNEKR
jgi:hypothetical protein